MPNITFNHRTVPQQWMAMSLHTERPTIGHEKRTPVHCREILLGGYSPRKSDKPLGIVMSAQPYMHGRYEVVLNRHMYSWMTDEQFERFYNSLVENKKVVKEQTHTFLRNFSEDNVLPLVDLLVGIPSVLISRSTHFWRQIHVGASGDIVPVSERQLPHPRGHEIMCEVPGVLKEPLVAHFLTGQLRTVFMALAHDVGKYLIESVDPDDLAAGMAGDRKAAARAFIAVLPELRVFSPLFADDDHEALFWLLVRRGTAPIMWANTLSERWANTEIPKRGYWGYSVGTVILEQFISDLQIITQNLRNLTVDELV